MKVWTTFLALIFLQLSLFSQVHQDEIERWPVLDKAINITGMDISPDGQYLALACAQNQGLLIYDWKAKSIVKEIDLKSESMGYSVDYSAGGNYLLLQEKRIETSFKRAKKCDYYIVKLSSGEIIHRFSKVSDVKIGDSETKIYLLDKDELNVLDLTSGKKLNSTKIEDACNALAVSPSESEIAVIIKPDKQQVAQVPSVRNNKKAIKANAKFRHMIAIYDANSLENKQLIKEMYDNVNLMDYNDDGSKLLCFNVAVNSYINVVDMNKYEPLREAYLGKSSLQPDFGYHHSLPHFAIATVDQHPAVNIYHVENGKMLDSYNTKMRIWKNMKQKMFAGTQTSFAFLPDDENIIVSYGNMLMLWNYKKQ